MCMRALIVLLNENPRHFSYWCRSNDGNEGPQKVAGCLNKKWVNFLRDNGMGNSEVFI